MTQINADAADPMWDLRHFQRSSARSAFQILAAMLDERNYSSLITTTRRGRGPASPAGSVAYSSERGFAGRSTGPVATDGADSTDGARNVLPTYPPFAARTNVRPVTLLAEPSATFG